MQNIPLVDTDHDVETVNTGEYSPSITKMNLYDWRGTLNRQLKTLNYLFSDTRETAVEIPVLDPHAEQVDYLLKNGTDDAPETLKMRLYDTTAINASLEKFGQLADLSKKLAEKYGTQIDEYAKTIMENVTHTFHYFNHARKNSLKDLIDYTNNMLSYSLKSSFNYYSPLLESEEIGRIRDYDFSFGDKDSYQPLRLKKSSQMKYDLLSDNWVAEDGSRSSFPFGVNQIMVEIFMPMVEGLMAETREQRLKIYNHIKDQKLKYSNEWHRDTEDFYGRSRAEINELGNRMRTIFAQLTADMNNYKSLNNTLVSMSKSGGLTTGTQDAKALEDVKADQETIAEFEILTKEYNDFIAQFTSFMDDVKEDINRLADEFNHVEYYEASLRDKEAHDMALAMASGDIDEKRKKLIKVNHLFAQKCEMPPAPKLAEQIRKDQDVNLLAVYYNTIDELNKLTEMVNTMESARTETVTEIHTEINTTVTESTMPTEDAETVNDAEVDNAPATADPVAESYDIESQEEETDEPKPSDDEEKTE